jgi:hypothetical protein
MEVRTFAQRIERESEEGAFASLHNNMKGKEMDAYEIVEALSSKE